MLGRTHIIDCCRLIEHFVDNACSALEEAPPDLISALLRQWLCSNSLSFRTFKKSWSLFAFHEVTSGVPVYATGSEFRSSLAGVFAAIACARRFHNAEYEAEGKLQPVAAEDIMKMKKEAGEGDRRLRTAPGGSEPESKRAPPQVEDDGGKADSEADMVSGGKKAMWLRKGADDVACVGALYAVYLIHQCAPASMETPMVVGDRGWEALRWVAETFGPLVPGVKAVWFQMEHKAILVNVLPTNRPDQPLSSLPPPLSLEQDPLTTQRYLAELKTRGRADVYQEKIRRGIKVRGRRRERGLEDSVADATRGRWHQEGPLKGKWRRNLRVSDALGWWLLRGCPDPPLDAIDAVAAGHGHGMSTKPHPPLVPPTPSHENPWRPRVILGSIYSGFAVSTAASMAPPAPECHPLRHPDDIPSSSDYEYCSGSEYESTSEEGEEEEVEEEEKLPIKVKEEPHIPGTRYRPPPTPVTLDPENPPGAPLSRSEWTALSVSEQEAIPTLYRSWLVSKRGPVAPSSHSKEIWIRAALEPSKQAIWNTTAGLPPPRKPGSRMAVPPFPFIAPPANPSPLGLVETLKVGGVEKGSSHGISGGQWCPSVASVLDFGALNDAHVAYEESKALLREATTREAPTRTGNDKEVPLVSTASVSAVPSVLKHGPLVTRVSMGHTHFPFSTSAGNSADSGQLGLGRTHTSTVPTVSLVKDVLRNMGRGRDQSLIWNFRKLRAQGIEAPMMLDGRPTPRVNKRMGDARRRRALRKLPTGLPGVRGARVIGAASRQDGGSRAQHLQQEAGGDFFPGGSLAHYSNPRYTPSPLSGLRSAGGTHSKGEIDRLWVKRHMPPLRAAELELGRLPSNSSLSSLSFSRGVFTDDIRQTVNRFSAEVQKAADTSSHLTKCAREGVEPLRRRKYGEVLEPLAGVLGPNDLLLNPMVAEAVTVKRTLLSTEAVDPLGEYPVTVRDVAKLSNVQELLQEDPRVPIVLSEESEDDDTILVKGRGIRYEKRKGPGEDSTPSSHFELAALPLGSSHPRNAGYRPLRGPHPRTLALAEMDHIHSLSVPVGKFKKIYGFTVVPHSEKRDASPQELKTERLRHAMAVEAAKVAAKTKMDTRPVSSRLKGIRSWKTATDAQKPTYSGLFGSDDEEGGFCGSGSEEEGIAITASSPPPDAPPARPSSSQRASRSQQASPLTVGDPSARQPRSYSALPDL